MEELYTLTAATPCISRRKKTIKAKKLQHTLKLILCFCILFMHLRHCCTSHPWRNFICHQHSTAKEWKRLACPGRKLGMGI